MNLLVFSLGKLGIGKERDRKGRAESYNNIKNFLAKSYSQGYLSCHLSLIWSSVFIICRVSDRGIMLFSF